MKYSNLFNAASVWTVFTLLASCSNQMTDFKTGGTDTHTDSSPWDTATGTTGVLDTGTVIYTDTGTVVDTGTGVVDTGTGTIIVTDTGTVVDTGTGVVDTGTSVADTGTGTVDTGTGTVDTGTGTVDTGTGTVDTGSDSETESDTAVLFETLCGTCTTSDDCSNGICLWHGETGESVCGVSCQITETVCNDTCDSWYTSDGSCDDGGPGSSDDACALGSDCTDCGVRYVVTGSGVNACPENYSCVDVGYMDYQCIPDSNTCETAEVVAGDAIDAAILDNMDDCDIFINPADGRVGYWYAYNSNCDEDVTVKGTQWPAAHSCDNNFNIKFEMEAADTGCVARTWGSDFSSSTGWAGMGFWLKPNTDPYDACAYGGIKVTVSGTDVRMNVVTPPFDSWNHVGIELSEGTHVIPWNKLASASTTDAKTFDCSQISNIQFSAVDPSSFDFSIDDIELVADDPSPVVTGCGSHTSDYYFCEDFESGLSNWIVSGSDWGLDTGMARSGDNSLSDSPDGNYPADMDASAILSGTVDLTGATTPVLQFWSSLKLASSDDVYVYASSDGGLSWTQLSTLSSGSNMNTWFPYQYSLVPYADMNIKLRFRLIDSYSVGTVSDGWYIDDIVIKEPEAAMTGTGPGGCAAATTTRYFCDSFEFGMASWQVSGHDWNTTVFESRTGTHSLTDSPANNYPGDADVVVQTAQPIDLTAASAPVLTFWHKMLLASSDDVYVYVSEDNGNSWNQLKTYSSGDNASTWTLQQLSLADYTTRPVLIRFRLIDSYSVGTVSDGWYIDDVEIRELM